MITSTKTFFTDLNDSQKQRLADKLLCDHPIRCNTILVEYVLSKSWEDPEAPFSWDDVTNYVYYGSVEVSGEWLELTEEERDEKVEELEDQQSELDFDSEEYDSLQESIDTLNNMYFDEKPEIYQWFSCSSWLLGQLEKHGECTVDDEFWGRQACGQSVTLDHVFQQIAFEYACDYNKDYLTPEQMEDL